MMIGLVCSIRDKRICNESELKCRLDVNLLIACKLVAADFEKNIIRMKSHRFYAQQKFNLIRDENEG